MQERDRKIRSIVIEVSEQTSRSISIHKIEAEVRNVLNSGVDRETAVKVASSALEKQKPAQIECDVIAVYDMPEYMKDLYMDPR